jgi:predicted enzyme related to lactoylglutathione lyase
MTTDTTGAMAFYKTAIGWGTQASPEVPSYVMWTARGTRVGGLMALPDDARRMGTPPSWVMYVAVPDVDATLRQAVGLGARAYVQPQDIPNIGRFAVLGDPQGATFALFSSTTEIPGHDGPAKPGEFSWHELVASDWRAAWGFYEQLFGWVKMDAMDMGPTGTYQMFGRGGQMLGGLYNKPREMPGSPHWLCYALVPNADSAATVVQRNGGKLVSGPMDVPGGGRIAKCVDPQGAAFALHSNAAETKAMPSPSRGAQKPATKGAKKPAKQPAKKRAKKPAKRKTAARSKAGRQRR